MKKKILILCTGNSCRSQMAEGILRHYGAESYEVASAGMWPSTVNKTAIQVMREIGIDISHQRSKNVSEFAGQNFDYVITVCDNAKESCPVFPGNCVRLHWSFPDPPHGEEVTERVVDAFRKVRDLIHKKFKRAAETGKFED
ncbi:MAG: arsenate reductase ArsC [Candidatus Omnitrophica bacterium]|nr:arsenate reductase ArsC [Candidatus Omnitrophota bacterium]